MIGKVDFLFRRRGATPDCLGHHEFQQHALRAATMTPMAVHRRITIERNRLQFAAAHMATFDGGCEPLHGHNYAVIVDLEGDLTRDSWVWDFGDIKQAAMEIINELDHKFILQRESRVLQISEAGESWEVRFEDRSYVFPRTDVAALPIDNSTAERLAEWVAGRLIVAFGALPGAQFTRLSVGIEEMSGQTGWYTVDL